MVTIDSMRSAADADAFRRVNEEWIAALFTLEDKDRATLADPFSHYVQPGGDVLLARDDDEIVGCVALEPTGDGVFELSKMAVTPSQRGRGTGRALVNAAIERARQLGGHSLFLGTNSSLAPAIALYESIGFRHVPRETIGPLPYERADVFMELRLAQLPTRPHGAHGPTGTPSRAAAPGRA